MSRRIGNVAVIEPEPDNICHECGKIAETRPYGPGGSEICFDCSQKMRELCDHNMGVKLFGEPGPLKGEL
jgi:hypothetical protein